MKSIKDYAIAYCQSGKSVFPCGKNKQPLIDWKPYQTRIATEEEIQKWWIDFPDANVAIITGKISGISVIDCDIGSDYRQFPDTVTIRTGSGGYHLYYKYLEGLGNKVGFLPHVDIRSDGGYVVAYPSVTEDKMENGVLKKKGGKYERRKSDDGRDLSDFPEDLIQEQVASKDWDSILPGVGQGSRNQNASEMIGKMLKPFKISEWENVWEMIKGWNNLNIPPLSEKELRATFVSISKREAATRKHEVLEEDDVPVLLISEVADQTKIDSPAIPTGVKTLDDILKGGVQEGDITVVSGATGQGKTFVCQSITKEMSNNKIPTLWFSYEMRIAELWNKFSEMGVDKEFISYSPLKMVTGNIDWVEKKIIESKEKFGTKVVFIDHLGFLAKSLDNPNDKSMSQNYSLYLGSLCRDLKSMAIKQRVSIFLLVHRTKDKEKVDDTSDIAHSAGIAQEADTVMMIRREKTNKTNEGDDVYTKYAFLSVVKNRKTGISKKITMEKLGGRLVETFYVGQSKTGGIDF